MNTMDKIITDGGTVRSSLSKLVGRKIRDVHGVITDLDGDPVFKLSSIVLEDDTVIKVEGEHDSPYLIGNLSTMRERSDRYITRIGMDSLLAKAYCESDAAWKEYCRTPTQSLWDLYAQAKRYENDLEAQSSGKEA